MTQLRDRINQANAEAAERMITAEPVLVDIRPATEVIPDFSGRMILHAGPPITWDRMCGPVRGAVLGAAVYEGWTTDLAGAEELAASGEITFDPCHHHSTVGPMSGVVSPSMWVFCVKNVTHGNMAYCTLNEGLGKVLRFGANDSAVISRLKWIEEMLAPSLAQAVRLSNGINLKAMIAQALLMGDECHNRNVAATNLFLKETLPFLLESDLEKSAIKKVTDFIAGNVHFFLNLSMPASKATADTIAGAKNCSLMSAMARNGTDIGIRVAGLGDRWFVASAGMPEGLYFPGFSEKDANPDLGDSTISETAGIGGFAMASAPAIVQFTGGKPADAIRFTREMYEISYGRHRAYQIPALDFAGTPIGVDIRKVVETGITPIINTGIAHREPGIGQIGAGLLYAPLEPFEEALKALAEIVEGSEIEEERQ